MIILPLRLLLSSSASSRGHLPACEYFSRAHIPTSSIIRAAIYGASALPRSSDSVCLLKSTSIFRGFSSELAARIVGHALERRRTPSRLVPCLNLPPSAPSLSSRSPLMKASRSMPVASQVLGWPGAPVPKFLLFAMRAASAASPPTEATDCGASMLCGGGGRGGGIRRGLPMGNPTILSWAQNQCGE